MKFKNDDIDFEDEEESKDKETFGTNVGEGIGCFLILIGLAIFFSFPAVISALIVIFNHCKK